MRPKLVLIALAALLALALTSTRGRGGEPFAALEARTPVEDAPRPAVHASSRRRGDLAAVAAGLLLGAFAAAAVVTAHGGDAQPPTVTETPVTYRLGEVAR